MENKKSDTKRFFETMWIMTKYDVLPWVVGLGLAAAIVVGIKDSSDKKLFKTNIPESFQKQR